ncbi:hypothetical protein [Psychrobacter sp. FDAARGOS_221]|uniref:hypothetical protein n=1 Tax=Psychrobacter sp. FDAARGOS_221 TaxID=1975705 RepID=UPI000BB56ED0|nr:hypothetical protein [Psychrobacter sp. FDAARGOS_221]PNK59473.1 hypothetical protein A6J60_000260 [Psychrobacter sp. FDAARGOS_221]PNK59913.1 hypothetical protein A6J60_002810 [Psychrobacter sp. FDAARGOS_221]PNK61459.1 hypothetical protein A6J60_011685 [Psychrobacter sp. FDAARGOS_221]
MSESTNTTKTVTLDELSVLMSFHYAKEAWDKEDTAQVSIDFDNEYKDFLVTTSENNVRPGRFSKLQAEITAWADQQIKTFSYQNKNVNAFVLTFVDDVLSIELGFESDAEQVDTEA